jgi:hypothetical protein
MSTAATIDFATFEAEVICPESRGRHVVFADDVGLRKSRMAPGARSDRKKL